jgi:hypothetical protein
MSYYIKQQDAKYQIVEKGTELVVQEFVDKDKARARQRHLNLGGGFNGFTPEFFCVKYPEIKETLSN